MGLVRAVQRTSGDEGLILFSKGPEDEKLCKNDGIGFCINWSISGYWT
jgi:hypothetical protein